MGERGSRRGRMVAAVVGGGAGALAGLGLSSAVYLLLTPVLEHSRGLVRELQGLLWNVVPLSTVAGGVLGWAIVRAHFHRSGQADVRRSHPRRRQLR